MVAEHNVDIGVRAVERGLISSTQLAEAIAEAKRLAGEGAEVDLLHVLVRKGFLSDQQAKSLMETSVTFHSHRAAAGPNGDTVEMALDGQAAGADAMGGKLLGGDFKIIRKLGSGGMGAVYLAEQMSLQRKVAVKVIDPQVATDGEYVARFKREAMSAAQLVHTNIIQVYSIGEQEGMWYIAMEYAGGKSVGDILKEESPMDVTRAANIIAQALKGLSRAHAMHIIHRDIKPDNLMLNADDEVKIADFGLARMRSHQDASLTASGAVMGTPHYMSPQQAEGKELNQQADIYSLGATFYHMVTGHTPFGGDSAMSILYKAGTSAPVPARERNPKAPVELSRLIEKMMARDLAVRYATCEDVLKDMNQLGYLGETASEARRRRSLPLIAGVALLVLVVGAAVLNLDRLIEKNPAEPKPAALPAPEPVTPAPELKPAPRPEPVVTKPEPATPKPGPQPALTPVPPAPKPEPVAPPVTPEPTAVAPTKKPEPAPKKLEPIEKPKPKPPKPIAIPSLEQLKLPPPLEAKKVVTVKQGGGGDFKTIIDAVAKIPAERAEPTCIDVYPGVYEGPILIGGEGGAVGTSQNVLRVRAAGGGPVVIKAGAERNLLWVNRRSFVSIEGIIFEGGGGKRGINLMHSPFFRIRECVFADCEEGAFSLSTGADQRPDEWSELSDCLFIRNKSAIVLDDSARTCIRNNVFVGNETGAINIYQLNGSIVLNIFSVPAGGGAILTPAGKKLPDGMTLNYNCYAGAGSIFVSGPADIKDIDNWRTRYAQSDENSLAGDPGFRSEAGGDFGLADNSRCRAGLPKDAPMGLRWSEERWKTFFAWWKGRKK